MQDGLSPGPRMPTALGAQPEPWRFRGVAWSPAAGGRAVVRRRIHRRPGAVARAAGVA